MRSGFSTLVVKPLSFLKTCFSLFLFLRFIDCGGFLYCLANDLVVRTRGSSSSLAFVHPYSTKKQQSSIRHSSVVTAFLHHKYNDNNDPSVPWRVRSGATVPFTLRFAALEEGNDNSARGDWDEELDLDISDFEEPVLFPNSSMYHSILVDQLQLSDSQCQQLEQLAHLLFAWNQRINLVSRKDCSPDLIFRKHILSSLAGVAVPFLAEQEEAATMSSYFAPGSWIIDVGTGGGFPGLPLAIAFPECNFVLLDSVGKKLIAIADIAQQLQLTNVQTHHGRSEEFIDRAGQFDVATGRSVSNLGQFCGWMHHLLKETTGRLLYWTGGDVEPAIVERSTAQYRIDQLLRVAGSDSAGGDVDPTKTILVFHQAAVSRIARDHPPKVMVSSNKPGASDRTSGTKKTLSSWSSSNRSRGGGPYADASGRQQEQRLPRGGGGTSNKAARGSWQRRGETKRFSDRDSSSFPRYDNTENTRTKE